jgi:hypothetical protein
MKTEQLRINDRTRTAIKSDGTTIPVIDGKFNFLIQPNEDDINNSIPGDHTKCMYCRACRRQYGSELVWVTRNLAYVELKGPGGKSQLHRFILSNPAKINVRNFDNHQKVQPEAVLFAAPTGRKTLDAQAAAYLRWVQGKAKPQKHPRKKAYLVGEQPECPSAEASKRKVPQPAQNLLRDRATGMFQFKTRKRTLNKCTISNA